MGRRKVRKIIVKKILTDAETKSLLGVKLPKGYFKQVIKNEDVDVYTEEGNILLRLRINILSQKHVEQAYDAMIDFAKNKSSQRSTTSGTKGKMTKETPIMSNILGYYDALALGQKAMLKKAGMPFPLCRKTAFTYRYPEKWKKVVPLIKDIDKQYKTLFPKHHKLQYKAAHSTKYVIDNTAFSTVTTNLNLQTACHTDKGNLEQSFGNLVVIEKGNYNGGYTGYPQYGVAVDLRAGDFVGMDIHQLHGNEPIELLTEDARRLSLVCYLRKSIVNKCQGFPMIPDDYFEIASRIIKERKKIALAKKKKKKTKNYDW